MSDSILDITHNHGREMYIIGIEHAVRMIEVLGGEKALEHLTVKVEKEKKELQDERAQQIRRRAPKEL